MATSNENSVPAYLATPSKHYELDGVTHAGYGISWHDGSIEDISCNCAIVSAMARLFTLCELPPSRLREAVVACLP